MRRTAVPAKPVEPSYYGGLKPTGSINADGFRAHDAATTWDDHGRAVQLAQEIADAIKAYGAEQVRDGVADYNSDAYLDMSVIDDMAVIVMDSSNEAAQFHVYWSLEDLLSKSASDAIAAGDEAMVQAIYTACERAVLMLQATPVATEPEPMSKHEPPARPVITRKAIGGDRRPANAVPQAVRRGR